VTDVDVVEQDVLVHGPELETDLQIVSMRAKIVAQGNV
jgi:hypothetical protein